MIALPWWRMVGYESREVAYADEYARWKVIDAIRRVKRDEPWIAESLVQALIDEARGSVDLPRDYFDPTADHSH